MDKQEFPLWSNRISGHLYNTRTQVPSLASLDGLRIQRCCELWCRLQTQLWCRLVATALIRPLA